MRRSRIRRGAWLAWALAAAPAGAEVTTDGSFGAAAPIAPVGTEYQILDDYGRYSGRNLFHSFGLFGVEGGRTASFSAENFDPALGPPLRIIARVTGGSPSLIDGTLRTVGGAIGADLFLLNPSGVTFGPTSRLDVQGSLHLSTAPRLRFENDPTSEYAFDATSAAPDPPLSIEHPSAFGFLGTGALGEIRFVQVGRTFSLPAGETFSAVGGAVSLIGTNRTAISVPSGRIQLASVDGQVDVPVEDLGGLTGEELAGGVSADSSPIRLERGFNLDVSASPLTTASSGRVVIRGGSLVIDGSSISAVHRSASEDAAGPAVDIEVVRGVEIRSGGFMQTRSSNPGDSGGIAVVADRLLVDGAVSRIESVSRGGGSGGPISLHVNELVLANGGRLFTSNEAEGLGGRIEIETNDLDATEGGKILSWASGSGPGGDIVIRADRVFVSNQSNAAEPATIASVALLGASESAKGGDVTLEAREIEVVEGGSVTTRTAGDARGGDLAIVDADRVVLRGTDASGERAAVNAFTTLGSTGSGGSLSIGSGVVEVLDGGQISTNTQGSGDAGLLAIQAAERLSVRGGPTGPSFISSDSRLVEGALVAPGAGGGVAIGTPLLELIDGGRITASTDGTRDAGTVRITAHDVVISGVDPTTAHNPSVVQSRSNADRSDGGDGGAIEIVTSGDVTVSDRGEITSSTLAGGDAGTIDVSAEGSLRLEREASIAARTEGSSTGNGGSVRLTAGGGISISGGSLVATESLGFGTAGDITIDAGPSLAVSGSAITTEASASSGGRITIIADQIIHLQGSELTTSVLKGAGGGGDIEIDPEFVVLDQSRIVAQAVEGAGGNITITAGTFFATPDSVVDASSELGIDGTVSIVAPDTDVTSGITTLPSDVLDATSLMRSACSAATAEGGSFVVVARPGLPVSPDGPLAAFDERTTEAGTAAVPASAVQLARMALAREGEIRASGCRRASEEVL
jgi:filamentous hemagglutinin family protein